MRYVLDWVSLVVIMYMRRRRRRRRRRKGSGCSHACRLERTEL